MSFSRTVSRLERITSTPICSPHTLRARPCKFASSFHSQYVYTRSLGTSGSLTTFDVKILADHLNVAATSGNIPEIHQRYGPLSQALKTRQSSSQERLLDHAQVSTIITELATSGRPFDLELIEKILADMTPLFGVVVAPLIHTRIIRALIKRGNTQTTIRWIMSMSRKPGNITPTLRHWHLYLSHLLDGGEFSAMPKALSQMSKSGRKPTKETFALVLEALFTSAVNIRQFRDIMDTMEAVHMPYEPSIDALIYDGFMKQGLSDLAHRLQVEYRKRFGYSIKIAKNAPSAKWDTALEQEAETEGVEKAVELCKNFIADGYKVVPHTFTLLLRHSDNVKDLRHAEMGLGFQAAVLQWALLINNALRKGHIPEAMEIYREFRTTGIPPDAPLIHSLIRALCQSTYRTPNDAAIDEALELYRDLVPPLAEPTNDADASPVPSRLAHRPQGPDEPIYGEILRAIGTSSDPSKYLPVVKMLIKDMQARSILLKDPMAIASVVIIFMRCSTSYDKALLAYQKICRGPGSLKTDQKGYQAILHALCKLSFPKQSALPSVWHYFEIVKDMRTFGYEITPPVYTILLRRLSNLATEIPPEWRSELSVTVRRVHDFLTLDSHITPDTVLWNQLMDSYQRVGLFADALRIWEMMFVSRIYNHASVSIILDACGFAQAWPTAMQICMKLKRTGFQFNQRTWNTWIECMCRMGKLNEAVKAVCLEMGKDQPDVAPDQETIQILISFAAKTNQQDEVMSRIKRYLPDLWRSLPEMMRGR
ncbi:hypothetical protein BJ138DRAFT_1069503 [Hygrophoropsis aurantiaca]|uniref:Uncharacterized protein n=1 Tax=Hygrophoropsis aurantiaca TaxID=72124 RepID=A0ACB8A5R8_9AGAM|nr:hypothetical protein BJ138DRAFT_1069503 [Hygrophoropsis aurantiaca]